MICVNAIWSWYKPLPIKKEHIIKPIEEASIDIKLKKKRPDEPNLLVDFYC